MEKWFKGFVALLAVCLVFVGAPRCIPTANLWNEIWKLAGHDNHAEVGDDKAAHAISDSAEEASGTYCPHHTTPAQSETFPQQSKTSSQQPKKPLPLSQDFMTDGAGCHCQVNTFVNATPVSYQQPKVVHVVMPRARDIVPPTIKTLRTQVTRAPESPPPKLPA